MSTQVQIRGAVQATQEARTLVSRELDINTTDGRLCVHDGSTAGGIRHVNSFDNINNEFIYAVASGTNALAITLPVAPSAYASGQKFVVKAANTNTGSVTLNVNSLGAKTLKKVSGGALVALSAGDIISGQIFTVAYDGTDFQIEIAANAVESGTWTPTLDFVTVTYTSRSGNYIKIADLVWCDFAINLNTINSIDTSPIAIGGLPYSVNTDGSLFGTAGLNGGALSDPTLLLSNRDGDSRARAVRTLPASAPYYVAYRDYGWRLGGADIFEGSFWYRTA